MPRARGCLGGISSGSHFRVWAGKTGLPYGSKRALRCKSGPPWHTKMWKRRHFELHGSLEDNSSWTRAITGTFYVLRLNSHKSNDATTCFFPKTLSATNRTRDSHTSRRLAFFEWPPKVTCDLLKNCSLAVVHEFSSIAWMLP